MYIRIKKVPPHAERSTNTFILTLQPDFVKHPLPTISTSEAPARTPKKALTDAPILAITNFRKTRLYLTAF